MQRPRLRNCAPRNKELQSSRRPASCPPALLFTPQDFELIKIKRRVPGLSESTLARFVSRAKLAVKVRGEVNVLVTSDSELRRLNHRFRGKNQPTDVLSFPANVNARGLAGDVAISQQIATYNALRLGHAVAQEVEILALHGILHLAGYDHEQDTGQMAAREARLRRALGLPMALIERNSRAGQKPKQARRATHPRKVARTPR